MAASILATASIGLIRRTAVLFPISKPPAPAAKQPHNATDQV
jgi:hypothetical protein